METLKKNILDIIITEVNVINDNNQNRINILKVSLIKDFFNKPIYNVEFNVYNIMQLEQLKPLINKPGETNVKIKYFYDNKHIVLDLGNKRKIEREDLNNIKKLNISSQIL